MDANELRNSLVALHSASFAWALVCCRERELAEDVLQSVYVKVLEGRAPFAGRSSFRTWLFSVIRNEARDRRRKRWWSSVIRLDLSALAALMFSSEGAVDAVVESEDARLIRSALGRLSERQRQVAHLVFYEEMTLEEAADVMEVRLGTARKHYARAKESLAVLLQPLWSRANETSSR